MFKLGGQDSQLGRRHGHRRWRWLRRRRWRRRRRARFGLGIVEGRSLVMVGGRVEVGDGGLDYFYCFDDVAPFSPSDHFNGWDSVILIDSEM